MSHSILVVYLQLEGKVSRLLSSRTLTGYMPVRDRSLRRCFSQMPCGLVPSCLQMFLSLFSTLTTLWIRPSSWSQALLTVPRGHRLTHGQVGPRQWVLLLKSFTGLRWPYRGWAVFEGFLCSCGLMNCSEQTGATARGSLLFIFQTWILLSCIASTHVIGFRAEVWHLE